jgi:hypothetical protein
MADFRFCFVALYRGAGKYGVVFRLAHKLLFTLKYGLHLKARVISRQVVPCKSTFLSLVCIHGSPSLAHFMNNMTLGLARVSLQ